MKRGRSLAGMSEQEQEQEREHGHIHEPVVPTGHGDASGVQDGFLNDDATEFDTTSGQVIGGGGDGEGAGVKRWKAVSLFGNEVEGEPEWCYMCRFPRVDQSDAKILQQVERFDKLGTRRDTSMAYNVAGVYNEFEIKVRKTLTDYGCPEWTRQSILRHFTGLHEGNVDAIKKRYVHGIALTIDALQGHAFTECDETGERRPNLQVIRTIRDLGDTLFKVT